MITCCRKKFLRILEQKNFPPKDQYKKSDKLQRFIILLHIFRNKKREHEELFSAMLFFYFINI